MGKNITDKIRESVLKEEPVVIINENSFSEDIYKIYGEESGYKYRWCWVNDRQMTRNKYLGWEVDTNEKTYSLNLYGERIEPGVDGSKRIEDLVLCRIPNRKYAILKAKNDRLRILEEKARLNDIDNTIKGDD